MRLTAPWYSPLEKWQKSLKSLLRRRKDAFPPLGYA
jgi:hypothetical protein